MLILLCRCFQATYLVDCITDKAKSNKILNIGGPDDGLTMTAQGKLVRHTFDREHGQLRFSVSKVYRFEGRNHTFVILLFAKTMSLFFGKSAVRKRVTLLLRFFLFNCMRCAHRG